MTRSVRLSPAPSFALRRAVATTIAAALALSATYALFLGTCALMLALGWFA